MTFKEVEVNSIPVEMGENVITEKIGEDETQIEDGTVSQKNSEESA